MPLDDFLAFDESSEDDSLGEIANEQRVYDIEGLKIKFPFEAYPCQLQLLENIIKTLNGNRVNALLESPTGSGKSMSILCGALAWLENQKSKLLNEAKEACNLGKSISNNYSNTTDGEEDFVPFKKAKLEDEKIAESMAKLSLPKIFICSRTHKQISQLVRELKRTAYRPKYVVLGSRTHYCINEVVRKERDINEGCRTHAFSKLGKGCIFYSNLMKTSKSRPPNYTPDCDIEELVKYGKKNKRCPYFTARAAIDSSEVIFAPYNYLIDPVVREGMGIDLQEGRDIVIIDEGHNIEDVCRESGSFEITDDNLTVIQGELLGILKNLRDEKGPLDMVLCHESQGHVISVILNWLRNSSSNTGTIRKDFETSITVWQDTKMVEELQSIGISLTQILSWRRDLQAIIDRTNDQKGQQKLEESKHLLSFGSCQILQGLYGSLNSIMLENNRFLGSFRMVKFQTTKMETTGRRLVFTLGFWCLNPEVVFADLSRYTKSIVITSGTLSPMDSFSSELNAKFEKSLEALHIIDKHQTWVGCIPSGPKGSIFVGNFKNMDSFAYQDDLCHSIEQVCNIVPGGILCFVPSYSFLDKLVQRMKNIGIYDQIGEIKKIFIEPRQGSPKDFEKLLNDYYKTIENTREISFLSKGKTGALLFAVYRGKISEGLDLKDDNCRAVLPIGIPYPAFKDPKVVLKREFNDKFGLSRRLLTGQQWYEIQAFRALNQALGRCIRHRHDWGAVILFEQRFTMRKNINMLSKWVGQRLITHGAFNLAMNSLQEFVKMNIERGTISPSSPPLNNILEDATTKNNEFNKRTIIEIEDN